MAKRTGLTHLLVSSDSITNEVVDEAIKLLASDGIDVKKHRMPVFEDLFPTSPDANSLFEKEVELPKTYDPNAFSAIMHSSGTPPHSCRVKEKLILGCFRFDRPPEAYSVDDEGARCVGYRAECVFVSLRVGVSA